MKFKYILLLCCAVAQLWAVGEAGAIFLLIAPGAGPAGTGEAQVAKADDVYASYYNPAGLGFLKGKEAAGMHVQWLPNLATDLYYEFLAYRHYIDGLGSVGGHIIYLNLGEQIGMDEFGNPTDNWKSYMGAIAGSFGTQLSESSSIGFNFKVFHQKLSDQVVAGEKGKGYSTDFGFDIGYLKKIKQSNSALKSKRKKKLNGLFDQLSDIYERQNKLNDQIAAIFETENNGYEEMEEQIYLLEDLEGLRAKFIPYQNMTSFSKIDTIIKFALTDMEEIINRLNDRNNIPNIKPPKSTKKLNDIDQHAICNPAENFIDKNNNNQYDHVEDYIDVNQNGIWDQEEPFTDNNGNNIWDISEPFIDRNSNGNYDTAENFIDINNNHLCDVQEPFTDRGNGVYDLGEDFTDINGNNIHDLELWYVDQNRNGKWDGGDSFEDLNNNGKRDYKEPYTDQNNNKWYDAPEKVGDDSKFNFSAMKLSESFTDSPNRRYDMGEEYEDINGDGEWNPGEEYEDLNGDGNWTSAEEYEDLNGDGEWTSGEEYEDLNGDGQWTVGEEYEDINGDGEWTSGEEYEDINGDGEWTPSEGCEKQNTNVARDESGADSLDVIMERILFNIMDIESIRENFITGVGSEEIQDLDDKFNFGFSISNIGPKIDFVDVDQADPSPTNMRLGIFAQLYNDGFNKVNFLFDANKLMVTRYQMMDWDGDGKVGGYDEFGTELGPKIGEYNLDGKKEYDSKGYMDDPWYIAIVTAWLDDWYFGGDIDYNNDAIIGGYSWEDDGDGLIKDTEMVPDPNGIYNDGDDNGKVEIEKGTGDSRSFTKELEEMVYNVGMEYWYTDAFALRAGYIHDYEGKIFNPTFGAGIRLLQYGFDFGYTAGETGHPRANTMFFSVNIKL